MYEVRVSNDGTLVTPTGKSRKATDEEIAQNADFNNMWSVYSEKRSGLDEGAARGKKRAHTGEERPQSNPPATTQPATSEPQDLRQDQPTLLDDIMPDAGDVNMEEPGPEARAAASNNNGGPSNAPSKETPISRYPTLTYGLQETHTTILPWSGWVSFGWLDKTTPLKMSLRMNAIWDIFPNDITDVSNAAITGKALHNRPLRTGAVNDNGAVFPLTMAAGTNTTERPQWRDYWAQIYEFYTVLGCEWKVTIQNSATERNADVLVGIDADSYSDEQGASGNVTPSTSLAEMLAFKGINWKKVDAPSAYEDQAKPNTIVLSGTYKPGQFRRNIINDGDVKTWTATSATLPKLKDMKTLYFFQDALSPRAPNSTGSGCGNIQIDLKYIVQFKDLKQMARYPNSLAGSTAITQGINKIETSITAGEGHDHVRYKI